MTLRVYPKRKIWWLLLGALQLVSETTPQNNNENIILTSLISKVSQSPSDQNLVYKFLNESQQVITKVQLDQRLEGQPEMRQGGQRGRATPRVATEREVRVAYGKTALLPCDCSYRGLVPHQTYVV